MGVDVWAKPGQIEAGACLGSRIAVLFGLRQRDLQELAHTLEISGLAQSARKLEPKVEPLRRVFG